MKDLIDIMKETAVRQTTLIIAKNHEVSIRKFFEEYGIKAEVKIDVDIKSIDIEKFEKKHNEPEKWSVMRKERRERRN